MKTKIIVLISLAVSIVFGVGGIFLGNHLNKEMYHNSEYGRANSKILGNHMKSIDDKFRQTNNFADVVKLDNQLTKGIESVNLQMANNIKRFNDEYKNKIAFNKYFYPVLFSIIAFLFTILLLKKISTKSSRILEKADDNTKVHNIDKVVNDEIKNLSNEDKFVLLRGQWSDLMEKKDYANAIKLANDITVQYSNAISFTNLSISEFMAGNKEKAVDAALRAYELDPDDAKLKEWLLDNFDMLNMLKDTLKKENIVIDKQLIVASILIDFVTNNNDKSNNYVIRGGLLFKNQKKEDEIADFKSAVRYNPNNENARKVLDMLNKT